MENFDARRRYLVPALLLGTALAAGGCAASKTKAEGVTEKYWKLVELNGQPVPALEREPYLILKAQDGRVNGFGGCNGFTGAYTINEAAARIRFERIASTLRACASGMEVEMAFHDVLRTVDNYSFDGERLTLNRARMAPLARFQAVYLQ